jgi:hypothetical protein
MPVKNESHSEKKHLANTQNTKGGGGVIHLNVKSRPNSERNQGTTPIKIDSYQKGHLFKEKSLS